MAIKMERQLKRKGTAKSYSISTATWKSKWGSNEKHDRVASKSKNEHFKTKEDVTSKNKGKIDSQPNRNRDIKCFKCLGSGHIASQCPNKRVMIMHDNGEVETESEGDSDDMPPLKDISENDGVEYPVEDESLVARRTLNAQI